MDVNLAGNTTEPTPAGKEEAAGAASIVPGKKWWGLGQGAQGATSVRLGCTHSGPAGRAVGAPRPRTVPPASPHHRRIQATPAWCCLGLPALSQHSGCS